MKRLLVRLSLLSLLVAAGVFAIYQSQRGKTEDKAGSQEEGLSPQVPLLAPPALSGDSSSADRGDAASALIPLPRELADAGQGSYIMPAPSETIVRGNDGPESAAAEEADFDTSTTIAQTTMGGASARSRNPFARRESTPAAAQQVPAASGDAAFETAAESDQPQSGEFQGNNGPTPAAPPAAAVTAAGYETEESTESTSGAAASYGDQNSYGGASGDAPTPAEKPATTLGPPRELPSFPTTTGDGPSRLNPPTIGESADFSGDPAPSGSSRFALPRSGSEAADRVSAGAAGVEGAGEPGPQSLEGAQTPSITLKKTAPPEIQVGKPATFEIIVQNVGRIAAHQVIVKEDIPRGVRLIDTAPPAAPQGSSLVWELGTLQPGDTRQIKLQYLPVAEGDLGSVAVAAFQAQASVRTVCTRPQLTIDQSAPEKVLIGQSFNVRIRLANPGTGVATKVVLEEDVPDGFTHPSGRALEYEVGSLRPGESRDLDLTLVASKPGTWSNTLMVRGEGNLAVEQTAKVEVVAPQLDLAMAGPTRRYLERQATYAVSIANPGTATAQDVKIVGRLPKGMKFVAANNEGEYDPETHAVVWALAELPPGQRGEVQLTALPVETGEQKIVIEGKGDLDVAAQAEHAVSVEALAELAFEIADKSDPIEINKETIYEIKVTNKGSKTANNIRLSAVFPAEMKPLAGDGPARAEVADGRVMFEPLARLNPREQAIFRIQAQGLRAGDQRIQVQLVSDESPTPVTKEESTRVYADQ
jgi:uncharacterized repeat protein (TIGR01451 family)